ncbi:hypothetical protein FB45DRAFT_892169 [Roridomyces roridus]|uniref:Alpha-amylase domain-containing protein n=1 Tax=Roridomyces roridus TaxID=1738132 RepID=A0AAD7FWC7_9AGAR|nr:hypothetical protein FB45DRAFT_892169 [Roridomyces roridus]
MRWHGCLLGMEYRSCRSRLWLSGYETNKPLVLYASKLTSARKLAIAANKTFISTPASWINQSDPSTIALSKPPLLSLFTNVGSNATSQPTWSIPAGLYEANTTLVDVVSCTRLVVGEDGVNVTAMEGLPKVMIPASMLKKDGGACPALAIKQSGATRRSVVGVLSVVSAVWSVVTLV